MGCGRGGGGEVYVGGRTDQKWVVNTLGELQEVREGSWDMGRSLCCNMMFILVMYLTVEDNRGLSVWLYEKNLNTNTKTFIDIEH